MRSHPSEKPTKGSWEAERRHFDALAREILRIQKRYEARSPASGLRRAFQAKIRLGVIVSRRVV